MYLETDSPINLGSNGNNGGFFGNGDGIWAILLFAMIFGWGNGNGFGGGFGGYGNNFLYDVNANTNRGFDNLALNNGIDNLQTAVTTGFANAEVARCNSTTSLLQAINGVQASQQACCCENRLAIANQTNAIQVQAAANHSSATLLASQNHAEDMLQRA